MIRPTKGQTNARAAPHLEREPLRDGPQGPPLRAGGGPDPAADLAGDAQARRPAPARAGPGGEARSRPQLRPRCRPHPRGDGHPRAAAGPWHRRARSLDRRPGGAARQRPHPQAGDGGRAAGRGPGPGAGPGGARGAQCERRRDRGARGDPPPPGAEAAARRACHRGGLAVPLRAGARCPQQRPAAGARRADGLAPREPHPLVAGAGPARALLRRTPPHPAGHQAPRCQGGGESSETAPERDRGNPDASDLTEVKMGRLFAVEISICVDDTLFKGVESWAWYGLQPINKLLKPGGTLIVTSLKEAEQLIPLAHRKETPYNLAVLKGTPSFSGLWVYKDDHTDVRVLGVMARVLPELFSLGSVQETIREEWKNELKATSALRAFE